MPSTPASSPPPDTEPSTPPPAELATSGRPTRRAGRVADLQLRGAGGPLPTRVYWPSAAPDGRRPGLLVFFPAANDLAAGGLDATDALCRALCAEVGLVVLATSYGTGPAGDTPATASNLPEPAGQPDDAALEDATTATHWSADHAAELGADPRRLRVGGEGSGAQLAAAVERHADEQGWPPISQMSIPPELVDRLRRSRGGPRR